VARISVLEVIAALAGVGATTTLVWQLVTAQVLLHGEGCGWDGIFYCTMARGQLAPTPFSRRPLTPELVHLLHVGPLLDRFLGVDLIMFVLAVTCTAALVRHLCVGLSTARANSAAVIAASVTVTTPFTLHFLLTYRANSDISSLALGLLWLLLMLRKSPWSALAAAGACLAREEWAPIVILACGVDLLDGRGRWRLDASNFLAATVALAVDYWWPHTTQTSASMLQVMHEWFGAHFIAPGGLERLSWMLLVGLGIIPLLLIPALRAVARRDTLLILTIAAGGIFLAIAGGDDTSRIVLPSAIALTVLAIASVAHAKKAVLDVALAVALVGSTLIWRPWSITPRATTAWLSFFEPYYLGNGSFDLRYNADTKITAISVAIMIIAASASFVHRPSHSVGDEGESSSEARNTFPSSSTGSVNGGPPSRQALRETRRSCRRPRTSRP
jgi:hypothetical protein